MAIDGALATSRRARTRAFSKARRHSRWVRFAKWAIPLGSLLAFGALMFVVIYDPFRSIQGLTLGAVSVSGTQVTMESPRLTGYRNDNRPYEVTATAATQDVRQPHIVELKDMRARLATDDRGTMARLEAAVGVLDTQKEQMQLKSDVRVRTDNGQEMELRSAFIDFKAGSVVSTDPVKVFLGNGTIEAKGIRVTDNGKAIQFDGRVHAVFESSQAPAGGASATPGQPGSFGGASTIPGQPASPSAQPSTPRP